MFSHSAVLVATWNPHQPIQLYNLVISYTCILNFTGYKEHIDINVLMINKLFSSFYVEFALTAFQFCYELVHIVTSSVK